MLVPNRDRRCDHGHSEGRAQPWAASAAAPPWALRQLFNPQTQVQSLSSIGSAGSPVPPGVQGGQFQHGDSSEQSPAALGRAVLEPDRGSPTPGKVKLFPARLSGRQVLFQLTSSSGRDSRFAGAQIKAQPLPVPKLPAITADKSPSLPQCPHRRICGFSVSGRF